MKGGDAKAIPMWSGAAVISGIIFPWKSGFFHHGGHRGHGEITKEGRCERWAVVLMAPPATKATEGSDAIYGYQRERRLFLHETLPSVDFSTVIPIPLDRVDSLIDDRFIRLPLMV